MPSNASVSSIQAAFVNLDSVLSAECYKQHINQVGTKSSASMAVGFQNLCYELLRVSWILDTYAMEGFVSRMLVEKFAHNPAPLWIRLLLVDFLAHRFISNDASTISLR